MKKKIKSFLEICFQITMPLFMIIGTLMVLVQFYCCFAVNGNLIIYIKKLLQPWASNAAGICMFAAFLDSYIKIEK